jgi:hypothetical protein
VSSLVIVVESNHHLRRLVGLPGANRFEVRSLDSGTAMSDLDGRAVLVLGIGPQSRLSARTAEEAISAGAAMAKFAKVGDFAMDELVREANAVPWQDGLRVASGSWPHQVL